jgi:hypothetical protein
MPRMESRGAMLKGSAGIKNFMANYSLAIISSGLD